MPVLVEMTRNAKSALARGRAARAPGYLCHRSSVEPLLEILEDQHGWSARMDAAIVFGLIGNLRDTDPLYELAGDLNYLATTRATFEILFQA